MPKRFIKDAEIMPKLSNRYSIALLLKLMFGSIIMSILIPVIVGSCPVIAPVIRIYISAGFMLLGVLGYIAAFSSIVYLAIRKQ